MVARAKHDYAGPGASAIYDRYFEVSHGVPHLRTHVPQGLATWPRWNRADDLLLITAYSSRGEHACLIAIDARIGEHIGTAKLRASHVGGIAVFAQLGWAFVSSAHKRKVRRYALEDLAKAIRQSDYVRQAGSDNVFGSSFLAAESDTSTLWAGRFDADESAAMRAYEVRDSGALSARAGVWQVPKATQGLVVTKGMFVYSCSWGRRNRSRIYLVRRGEGSSSLEKAHKRTFRAPSMSEGMTLSDHELYVVYESGAHEYRKGERKPRNIIDRLHRAPLSELERLCREKT